MVDHVEEEREDGLLVVLCFWGFDSAVIIHTIQSPTRSLSILSPFFSPKWHRKMRLVLLTTHSTGGESSTRTTSGGAGTEDKCCARADGDPECVSLEYEEKG